MKIINKFIFIFFIIFSGIRIVNAYNNLDCPTNYLLLKDNICIKIENAKELNGDFYCDDGELQNDKCVKYFYLDEENTNNNVSNTQTSNVNISKMGIDYDHLCSSDIGVQRAVKILGYVILTIKWIVPLIIIILGMVDFTRAVISNDDKAIGISLKALIRRFIAGIAVFLIIPIILTIINILDVTSDIEHTDPFIACTKCILDINECN